VHARYTPRSFNVVQGSQPPGKPGKSLEFVRPGKSLEKAWNFIKTPGKCKNLIIRL